MQTVIFGAGASVPFFSPVLNTRYLTYKVSDKAEWDRVMRKYRVYKSDQELVPSSLVVDVISRIKFYKPNAHFEQIAEIIDKISSYGYDHIPFNNMMNLQWAVMRSYGFNSTNSMHLFDSGWRDVPFLLREIIAESILHLKESHKSKQYDLLMGLQRDFLDFVSKQSEETSVLSFNYDDCVIDSINGLGFEKGFAKTSNVYQQQLDPSRFLNAKQVVYFPHGHIKYQFTDSDNVTFWSDSKRANEERWNHIDSCMMGSTLTLLDGKYSYNFNTFITTGQTKDDSFNHLPYSAYYQRLAYDLVKSDVVYLIGYSFGDDHVNRLLQSFLKIKSTNKVYVVDYYKDDISLTDEYRDTHNIITKIHTVFGTLWQLKVDYNSQKQPIDKAKVNAINSQGYGELFDNVFFYKKGYDSFLREYRQVI